MTKTKTLHDPECAILVSRFGAIANPDLFRTPLALIHDNGFFFSAIVISNLPTDSDIA